MGSNEELYEYYGWKAAEAGVFKEWQTMTSSMIESNPEIGRWEAGQNAYNKLVGSND